jgi:hypothetical protein
VRPGRPRARLLPCACGLLLACSALPDYAAPKGRVIDASEYDASDVIPYRTLTRDDFRGTGPPAEFAPYAERVGAATCGYIMPTPGTRLAVRPIRLEDGRAGYEAAPQGLGFRAQMDRRCSWWNREQHAVPPDYVLEHEQIHFALFEIEARRLDASSAELAAELRVTASTPEEAVRRAQQRLEVIVARVVGDVVQRSRAFDEDTSLGYAPERQKVWWSRVQAELAATH